MKYTLSHQVYKSNLLTFINFSQSTKEIQGPFKQFTLGIP